MSVSNKRIAITVGVLVAFASLIAGIFVAQHFPDKKIAITEQFKGTLLTQPREIKPFALTGIDETAFDNQSLKGHWTLLFFGFTNCGSICPTTMAELGKMYRLLEKDKIHVLPQVVMVSVDPARDNLPKLANYVKAFDLHFFGARGETKAVHHFAKELGIAYIKVAAEHGTPVENYTIQHSGTVMLFNPQGELVAFFTPPLKAQALASDYTLLVS